MVDEWYWRNFLLNDKTCISTWRNGESTTALILFVCPSCSVRHRWLNDINLNSLLKHGVLRGPTSPTLNSGPPLRKVSLSPPLNLDAPFNFSFGFKNVHSKSNTECFVVEETAIISHYYWVEIHLLLCMRFRNFTEQNNET